MPKEDKTDPVIVIIHDGAKGEVPQDVIDANFVENPAEENPIEDTYKIVDD